MLITLNSAGELYLILHVFPIPIPASHAVDGTAPLLKPFPNNHHQLKCSYFTAQEAAMVSPLVRPEWNCL